MCEKHFREKDIRCKKLPRDAYPMPVGRLVKQPEESFPQPSTSYQSEEPSSPQLSASFRTSASVVSNVSKNEETISPEVKFTKSSARRTYLKSKICLPLDASVEEVHFLTPTKSKDSTAVRSPTSHILQKLDNIRSPKKRKLQFQEEIEDVSPKKRTRKSVKNVKNTLPRSIDALPPFSKSFTRMQLYHKNRQEWQSDEKNVALSLYYKSPSNYKFMRQKGCILPAPSTLRKWLQKYKFQPGANKTLQRLLKLKAEAMEENERECVLCFDEMAIKQSLEYSKGKDKIEGFEDLGHFGRTDNPATEVLVFCLRGLYSTWKIPISYYFSTEKKKCYFNAQLDTF